MFTLFPLTIDRFIAVVFATKYKVWVTTTISWILVILSWMPSLVYHILFDGIKYALGKVEVR